MRTIYFPFLFMLAITYSCKNTITENKEACSIKVGGVEFTESLNGARSLATVEAGKLLLKSNAKSDYFNEPDGKVSYSTAPVLLSKIDNRKPFTFTTRVTPTFIETYDAGTLYIYSDSKRWFKFAFERDERMNNRIVTVRTLETSDDNNHDVITIPGVFMKISSDTKTVGFYYSLDNKTWQLVRLFRNDFPAEIGLGVSTQSPVGNGTSSTFEELSLVPNSVKDFRMGI